MLLNKIRKFFYSKFYSDRYYRRTFTFQLQPILNCTSSLLDNIKIDYYKGPNYSNAKAQGNTIWLNQNKDIWDDSEFSLILHEFGHLQYKEKPMEEIVNLNNALKFPLPIGLENEKYLDYFSDKNEIRQRILPIVYCMYKNNFNSKEAYYYCYDDLYLFYSQEQIIYWIENIL